MAKLTIQSGPQAGMELNLDRPSIRIGRGSGSDLVLQDNQSSRQHAEISRQGDQFYIRDLGSTNGTQVNGKRIGDWQRLADGDQVVLGDVPLTVQLVSRTTAGAKNAPTS